MTNIPSVENILHFWFGPLSDAVAIDKKSPPAKLWFNGGRVFDEEIRSRYLGLYEKGRSGEYVGWEASAQGCLALILIFDQFSRNMFRNTPRAFETDPLALELTLRTIKDGFDKNLMCVERVFVYMPLMHAEDLRTQQEGVHCFEALVEESHVRSPLNTPYFEYNLKFSRQHRDIIARFGRFPHRNAILGRPSTSEEKVFLANPGVSF